MLQLILTVLSIALMASLTVATVNYAPAWVPAADRAALQARDGFQKLESAFLLRAAQNNGVALPVDTSRADGGLAISFQPYLAFVPRAPAGYAWTYGFTSKTQLIADGYAGNVAGGLYWFCLYRAGPGASEGMYRGLRRAQQSFSIAQYYVSESGCGRAIDTVPSAFPTPAAVTLFVRYIAPSP